MGGMPAARRLRSKEPLPLDALEPLSDSELRRTWRKIWGVAPPRRLRRDLLLLGLAWRLQAQAEGGLRSATERRLLKLADKRDHPGVVPAPPIRLKPGTRLLREWRGEAHEVEVLPQGFGWRGARYASLSEIAREITGARWSGPRFFGLREPEARHG